MFPEERIEFWRKAEHRLGFNKEKTMLVDDTLEVLETAKRYGIKYLIYKAKSSSKLKPLFAEGFTTILDFRELINTEREITGKVI